MNERMSKQAPGIESMIQNQRKNGLISSLYWHFDVSNKKMEQVEKKSMNDSKMYDSVAI